jgi:Arc/MetJ-type ribon-helix-helix transcriptional regulator
MTIALKEHHEKLLRAEVAAGRFVTIEDAVAFALDHFLPGDIDDLDWAQEAVDAGRASAANGVTRTIAETRQSLQDRIARLDTK